MKLEELYARFDEMVNGMLNVSPVDHFLFDLADPASQESLKGSFPGIEQVIMPEAGKYLVIAPIVENQDCLVILLPEQTSGSLALKALNRASGKVCDLADGNGRNIEDFTRDFANSGDIAMRFNEFAFNQNGVSTDEVKDIGSFDITSGEPVEVVNNNDNNIEDTEMKFKPIQEETDDTKWVEIPNTNAHGVTVTEDDAEDPFADAAPAQDGQGGGDANAAAPAQDANAGGDAGADAAAAPAEGGDASADAATDDPKAKMRELLSYYTNYMNELVQDPNTSTELIAATQEMIDSLISNMESADAIEEVKADSEEEVKADASADAAPAEETPADGGGEQQANEGTDEQAALDAKIDAEVDAAHANDWENIEPATSDDVLTPGDIANSPVNDVSLDDVAPTSDEELAGAAPDMTAQPLVDDLDGVEVSPEEEDDLLGLDATQDFGADGLPVGDYDGDIDDMAASTVPAAKKISWSNDYALNGVATSDDNTMVVPEVLKELADYYTKVANEVSKVPGKEDVAMKLQKIQILSQTIANEWDSVLGQIGDTCCANSYDRSNMADLEKDELDNVEGLAQVHADVAADDEAEMEDDLAINDQIASFMESFKHMF